jgi:hypothetical protein
MRRACESPSAGTRPAVGRNGWAIAATGAGVSLAASSAGWVAFFGWLAGAPWAFVLIFLLLGATGFVVGLAATVIERTPLALAALGVGSIAPLTFLYWLLHLAPDAFS